MNEIIPRPEAFYLMECPLCWKLIQAAENRVNHGLGECAEICERCDGTGERRGEGCSACGGFGAQKAARP
jgi:DnaJ-class molecular chaperone